MQTPILGGQYITASPNAAANRVINLYPEAVPEGGKQQGFLTRCPGLLHVATVGSGPIRGMLRSKGFGYVVSGNSLYKIDSTYTSTFLGYISGTGPVSMADNGIQLFIAANPLGYIYNTNTEVFSQITDPDFPGAVTVDYLDGYFVFNEPDSQKFWVTSLLDGTAVDPLEFASSEGNPDNLVALRVDHREVWLFGDNSIEVFYNSGALNFPLDRLQGAFIELGCLAAYSIAKLDNSLFWLGSDARGTGIVYRANGYTGTRVSNHAVEAAIQSFSTVSDAIAYTYQQSGHSFYVLTFPTADRTFVFDVATGEWHERAGYSNGLFHRHRSNCQMVFNDKVHVGDYLTGKLYQFSLTTYADGGEIQKWLRSWRALPTGQNSLVRMVHHQLQLDCESGVGLNSGQGEDALVRLRWSDDGGHKWSNYHLKSLGRIGETLYRVIWRRLGMTRDRVYELSGTDPNRITIMGAELQATEAGT